MGRAPTLTDFIAGCIWPDARVERSIFGSDGAEARRLPLVDYATAFV